MKKYLTVMIALSTTFLLAACSDNSTSDTETNTEVDETEDTDEELMDDEAYGNELNELEEIDIDVKEVKHYKWIDEAIQEETITVYAEIENTR